MVDAFVVLDVIVVLALLVALHVLGVHACAGGRRDLRD